MKKVLSIGQCDADNQRISHMLNSHFQIEYSTAEDQRDALSKLNGQSFDIVLVNRILDSNGAQGLEIISEMKSNGQLKSIPVMLVSNFQDAQESAVAAGAEPGFGKSSLGDEQTIELLQKHLAV